MSGIRLTRQQVDDDLGRFIEGLGGSRGRWFYCMNRMTAQVASRRYGESLVIAEKGKGAAARIINNGMSPASVYRTLRAMRRFGGNYEALNTPSIVTGEPRLKVGPLPAWCVGHVYFLRVASHPHVAKIGFSRRVMERIDDIRSKTKSRLDLVSAHAGTLLDEQQWHRSFADGHIDGEWFFVPSMPERTLPDFLAAARAEAA